MSLALNRVVSIHINISIYLELNSSFDFIETKGKRNICKESLEAEGREKEHTSLFIYFYDADYSALSFSTKDSFRWELQFWAFY
jgi:hypothetical protein